MIVHFEESPPTKKLRALTSMAAFVRENKVILLVVDPQIDFHEGSNAMKFPDVVLQRILTSVVY